MSKIDPVLAHVVRGIMLDHQVGLVVSFDWGREIVPHCTACGYFGDTEDPALHTANVVLEYVEEYYKERFGNEGN